MSNLKIRKTTLDDLDAVMKVYAEGREIMVECGNLDQWPEGYPHREIIGKDIAAGNSYVCVTLDEILAVFYLSTEPEKTYNVIDGAWLNDEPYGVIHRIARIKSEKAKGVGKFCLDWSFRQTKNIRIDTHEDNAPMRKLLEELGYVYCGIIWIETGAKRMAFQKIV